MSVSNGITFKAYSFIIALFNLKWHNQSKVGNIGILCIVERSWRTLMLDFRCHREILEPVESRCLPVSAAGVSEDPGVQAPSAYAERVLLWDHWEQWNPPADLQAAGGDKLILKPPLIAIHKSMPDQSAQYVLESIQKATISFMWPFGMKKNVSLINYPW